MLFNFELRPLADVAPWGDEDHPSLHWFGLTDGHYWLDVGEHQLFAYSEACIEQCGAPTHVDYQIVRLYEDVLSILPHVLEPMPSEFSELIIGDGALWLESAANYYAEGVPGIIASKGPVFLRKLYASAGVELKVNDENLDIVSKATDWRYRRLLDTLYLFGGPRIAIWSNQTDVFIGWDNRDIARDGVPMWSAQQGIFSLKRNAFLAEVQSFHDRLIDQMNSRVAAVLNGVLSPAIKIDHRELQQEQLQRAQALQLSLQRQVAPTDWERSSDAVTMLVQLAESESAVHAIQQGE